MPYDNVWQVESEPWWAASTARHGRVFNGRAHETDFALAILLASAKPHDRPEPGGRASLRDTITDSEPMERALIIGKAETPDPVLTRIRELEKDGGVKDVVGLESFPLQISLSATKKIIDELNKIPRVGALH